MSKLTEWLHGTKASAPVQSAGIYSLADTAGIIRTQSLLTALGYLDPPADGKWGGTSDWALYALTQYHATDPQRPLPVDVVAKLRTAKKLPIIPGNDFLGRVVKAMLAKGQFVNAHPACRTIVTAEGHDINGQRNNDARNVFNDAKLVFHINDQGAPVLDGAFEGTTTPGFYWSRNPMHKDGAFNIAPGQQKAWTPGEYHGRALRQVGILKGYRDRDRQSIRDLRYPVSGDDFGVHHHQGYNLPKENMRNASAGCQVIRATAEHERFMDLVLADARHKANSGYVYMASVLEQKDVAVA